MWGYFSEFGENKKDRFSSRGGKKHAFTHSYFKALPPHGIWEGSV
jgi:hypothetical protein